MSGLAGAGTNRRADMSATKARTPLVYLRDQLNDKGDFLKEYKTLSREDKADLALWARREMEVLGLPIAESVQA